MERRIEIDSIKPNVTICFMETEINNGFFQSMLQAFLFGILGTFLALIAFLLFDLITPKLSLQEQLTKGNVAVGIVVSSLFIGAFYLASVAVH